MKLLPSVVSRLCLSPRNATTLPNGVLPPSHPLRHHHHHHQHRTTYSGAAAETGCCPSHTYLLGVVCSTSFHRFRRHRRGRRGTRGEYCGCGCSYTTTPTATAIVVADVGVLRVVDGRPATTHPRVPLNGCRFFHSTTTVLLLLLPPLPINI